MYKKKFNNYSYVGYGQCGITGKNKRPHHTYNHQELRKYLIRYQWAYQKGYYLPKLPESLYDIFYEIKGIFNVATAPISEMLRASRWLRRATYESSGYYQERQQTKRKTYGVPKIDFTNDKVTDILKWRIIVEQINRYKTILGVSADVLAKEAKLSKPTVLKLLHGDTTVQVGNVLKVLNALEHRRKNWFKSAEEERLVKMQMQ